MTVTFTTNLGLAKPDIDEIARNWTDLDKLQEDNNNAFLNALPTDTSYSPFFETNGNVPSVGTGAAALIYGRYIALPGNFIMGWVVLVFDDPGITVGTGDAYAITLPLNADTAFHQEGTAFNSLSGPFDVIGEGFLRDDSDPNLSMSCAIDLIHVGGISYMRFNTEAYTGKTNRFWAPGAPFTVADGDKVSANFFYKAA